MSGVRLPLRSLWFGDGLTSASTEESARNADTGMTGEYSCISKIWLHVCVHGHNPRFVQKHGAETGARAGGGQASASNRARCGARAITASRPAPAVGVE